MYRCPSVSILLLSTALIAAPAARGGAPGPDPAQGAPMPLVLRGAEAPGAAEGEEPVNGPAAAVAVLKGDSAVGRPTPGAADAGALPAGWYMAAGENLWLLNVERELVVACRETDTTEVGVRDIECTAEDLPGLADP